MEKNSFDHLTPKSSFFDVFNEKLQAVEEKLITAEGITCRINSDIDSIGQSKNSDLDIALDGRDLIMVLTEAQKQLTALGHPNFSCGDPEKVAIFNNLTRFFFSGIDWYRKLNKTTEQLLILSGNADRFEPLLVSALYAVFTQNYCRIGMNRNISSMMTPDEQKHKFHEFVRVFLPPVEDTKIEQIQQSISVNDRAVVKSLLASKHQIVDLACYCSAFCHVEKLVLDDLAKLPVAEQPRQKIPSHEAVLIIDKIEELSGHQIHLNYPGKTKTKNQRSWRRATSSSNSFTMI